MTSARSLPTECTHRGGRANRPGTPALYFALDSQTAVREYQQLSPLMPPGTLGELHGPDRTVDFRAGYDPKHWSALWKQFNCDWRNLWFNQRTAPPGWALADQAMAEGAKGIVFASALMPGGFNLVVYTGMLDADDLLQVYDPNGMLPRNQDSWL